MNTSEFLDNIEEMSMSSGELWLLTNDTTYMVNIDYPYAKE